MRGLGREAASPSRRLKEAFVCTLTLFESVSSPGSSHKADVDWPGSASAVLSERVQRLLCMPVRDALPQISASSQMRDRCSRQPVDAERGLSLLITATWVMETSFFFFLFFSHAQMMKPVPGCQFKAGSLPHCAGASQRV